MRGLPAEPHVLAVSPMVSGAGFASRGAASRSIAIIGVDAEPYQRIVDVPAKMVSGRFQIAPGEAVIGKDLARDLGAAVGDRIQVVSTEGRSDVFRVNGTFDLGVRDLNKRWVIVPLRSGQTLMNLPGGVTNIDLKVDNIFLAEEVAGRISARTGLLAESWMAVNTQLLNAFKNQTMVTRTVRLFLILIVALGIASVLVVSVVQKQREIGILRAMGASARRIMWVFLIQGAIVGAVGAVLGGAVAATLVFIASQALRQEDGTPLLETEAGLWIYLSAGLISLAVGILAAAAPARRAAKMDPVEAIRYG
jgi:lipoprotein-releasing system permease protein